MASQISAWPIDTSSKPGILFEKYLNTLIDIDEKEQIDYSLRIWSNKSIDYYNYINQNCIINYKFPKHMTTISNIKNKGTSPFSTTNEITSCRSWYCTLAISATQPS